MNWLKYFNAEAPASREDLDLMFAQLCYVVAAGNGAKDLSIDTFRLFAPPKPKQKMDMEFFKQWKADLVKHMGFKPVKK